MRSALSMAFAVSTLSLCFVACGDEFTSAATDAAGAPTAAAGSPGDGGAPSSGGGSGSIDEGAGRGGAPDSNDGGRNATAGAAGDGSVEPASDAYRAAVMADDPRVYWRMGKLSEGTVADETGGGNALVLQGGGHQLDVAGAVKGDDTAIGFDGASNFAIATDGRALDFAGAAAFTLECWARRETGGASYFQHLISSIDGVANNRDGYALYLLPEPAAGETGRSVFERDRPAHDVGIFGAIPKPSVWAHYVAVFDGMTVSIYVNGTLSDTGAAPGNLSPRATPFAVARATGGANFFKGALDEIAVYAHPLTPAAIAKHFAFAK